MHCWRGVVVHTSFLLAQPLYLLIHYLINPNFIPSWIHPIAWLFILTRISLPFFRSPLRHLPSPPVQSFLLGHLSFGIPTDYISRMLLTPNDGLLVLWAPFYLAPQILPTRPDTMMDLLNSYDWHKPITSKIMLSRIAGKGLLDVEGNTHKTMRKDVAPAFSGRNVRDLVPLFYSKGLEFASSISGTIEMMSEASRVTLDIMGIAGLGKVFEDGGLASLYATVTDMGHFSPFVFMMINVYLPNRIVKYFPGGHGKRAIALIKLREEVRALVREKKEKPLQNDILSTIMKAGDFSDEYLVDQLMTFLAAGHETTATALTWTTMLLAKNPEIQDRLREECTLLKTADATSLDAMTYLTAVCNESLRLYPPAPATVRYAVKPTIIGGQVIPKGTQGLVPLWAINRDPELWDDAETFNPDRWLEGPNAAHGGVGSPYAFTTFLYGPRSCIGQGFARLELKCLLAALISKFRLELADPEEKIELSGMITIRPKNGLRLRLCEPE